MTNSGPLGCGFPVGTGLDGSDEQPAISASASIAISSFFIITFQYEYEILQPRMPRFILLEAVEKLAMDWYLERLHEAIASATRGMTTEDLRRHPEGKWSAAEVLEHLYLTYTGTVKGFERCLQAGMDGYLAKPLKPAELFAAIDAAVTTEVSQ